MVTGNNFLRSVVCFVLILFIALPTYPEIKGAEVNVELKDESELRGELLRVEGDEIFIYESEKVHKLKLADIKKIGIKRRSRFWTGVLYGAGIGFSFGSILSLLTKADTEGFVASEAGQFFLVSFVLTCYGIFYGAIASIIIPKYKNYYFSTYSDAKKSKFLKKIKKFARK